MAGRIEDLEVNLRTFQILALYEGKCLFPSWDHLTY